MTKEKSRILAQLPSLRDARPRHFWATTGVAAASLFAMVAAFGTMPGTLEIERSQQSLVEQLVPQQALVVEQAREGFAKEERIQRGDTVAALLNRLGVADPQAVAFLQSSREAAPIFRQLSPGKSITARVGTSGELQSLIFPLNGGTDRALFVEGLDRTFNVTEQALQLDTQVAMKTAEIRHSLFGATDAAGIPDSVATGLADIFGGDIDFHRDLRKGDRFSVVFESITHRGRMVRSGRILAAEFVNNGKIFSAVWFGTAAGQGGYYTVEGKNIRKAFLRSPLEFSRVTSGFTAARFHPVLQKWRAHKGTDYGAPVGTRVKATGDAIVEFVGTQGGYGKAVVLRHQGRYTTLYGHLSGFAGGVKKGSRVSQGEVIGYVGATGLASGPHLHYEFRINNIHQNPLSVALPTAPPLAPEQLAKFRETTQPQLVRIELIRGSNLALLD
ncbi:MAG: peptidoglycan DD-metalloendopeptidase family protein [Sulfurisoma sp.]|nr:peptidoglycan DD-metalloendopeptidase family protein [Sulfurisoma sp.]